VFALVAIARYLPARTGQRRGPQEKFSWNKQGGGRA